jgi:DNA-binding LytR/AlgR family response regulator
MRILIVEDEIPAQKRLTRLIQEVIQDGEIAGTCTSVESAIGWFRANPMPDLVFMDIQLADGRSFEIFQEVQVTAPVIFITAFDQYAIDAFRVQSIDYILKPVTRESLEQAWEKLGTMRKVLSPTVDYREKLQALEPGGKGYKKRFVIRYGEHIRTIPADEVAYFYTEHKVNFLVNQEGRKFPIEFNLDQLESMLDPEKFFRINRQYIIGIHAIADMRAFTKGRVLIHMQPPAPHETIVSVERSAAFKQWLGEGSPER